MASRRPPRLRTWRSTLELVHQCRVPLGPPCSQARLSPDAREPRPRESRAGGEPRGRGHWLWLHLPPSPPDPSPPTMTQPVLTPVNPTSERGANSCQAHSWPQRCRASADVKRGVRLSRAPGSHQAALQGAALSLRSKPALAKRSSLPIFGRANATILKYVGCYFCEIVCLCWYIPQLISNTIKFESRNIFNLNWSPGNYMTVRVPCCGGSSATSGATGDAEVNAGHVSKPPGSCGRRQRTQSPGAG